jgi:hypothetical protein
MNALRRSLTIAGILSSVGAVSGCVTTSLFKPHEYEERISSILITADGKKLIVITKKYHYIFDAPTIVVNTIKSTFHSYVRADFSHFRVDSSGKIKGDVKLSINSNAPESEIEKAVSLGYKNSKYFNSVECEITGIRYDSNGIEPMAENQKLNKEYIIVVTAEQSYGEKAAKSLLTPITITADGVLVLAAIPLLAVFVGIMAFVCRGENGCK